MASPTTTTKYRVVVTDANGCVATDSVTVRVNPAPTARTSGAATICEGDSVQLSVTGTGSYSWQPIDGLSCSDCARPKASPTTTTMYYATVSNASGCADIDSVMVTVNPLPKIDAPAVINICQGQSAVLPASGGVSYAWHPGTNLSCTSCASPTATPTATTMYYVTGIGRGGCANFDSILVVVDPAPRTARAHIDRTYRTFPNGEVAVPVVLDEPLDLANVNNIDFSLDYDPGVIQLTDVITKGTLVADGWYLTPSENNPATGRYRATLISVPPKPLKGTGTFLMLRFVSFIGTVDSTELPFAITLNNNVCTEVVERAGALRLDSVCGLDFRLLEAMSSTYALQQNAPNPFNPTTEIGFSLGLDGDTRLDIFDAAGVYVATLVNEHLAAGEYSVRWDAAAQPSGFYYYRVISGDWSRSGRMMLVK
jgi:hypothetical protein